MGKIKNLFLFDNEIIGKYILPFLFKYALDWFNIVPISSVPSSPDSDGIFLNQFETFAILLATPETSLTISSLYLLANASDNFIPAIFAIA